MTDPRYTDPRYRDPQISDPVSRRDQRVDSIWGWIAGLAVVVLIAFIIVAGWNGTKHTASNPPPATTGSASHTMPPPSGTTGQGPTAPMAPHKAAPAPQTK